MTRFEWAWPEFLLDPPPAGSFVTTHAGVYWRIRDWEREGDRAYFDLEPIDGHDLPPTARPIALSLPLFVVGEAPTSGDKQP
jgi:hypothetical protein